MELNSIDVEVISKLDQLGAHFKIKDIFLRLKKVINERL
jgi:hypothetical protein